MEQSGRNPWQQAANGTAEKTAQICENLALGCYQLPPGPHGKQGVCRGLPPVAGGPLPEREEVDLFRNAKSCEPEGPQDLTQRV
jgi:hypothetical protein